MTQLKTVLILLLFFITFSCTSLLPKKSVYHDTDSALTEDLASESDSGISGNEENAEPGESLEANTQSILDEALDFCQASQELWQKGELENAIQALDQAYSLIMKVDTYNIPKLIQQKEDLRFMISKRILEIYASRITVVNGTHKAIPLILNKHVQNEIDLFTKGREKQFFMDAYVRSGKYRPQIVKALKEAGLPESLSWLPLIESGFKTRALSKARALGLWQFIPSTGYKFGLKRDIYIDERLDPDKSTQAAIEYLKELHQIFGDWTTALAAYNCGEGRVLQVIRRQNVNYLDNFWDLYEMLPFETARYVPKFLATLHIINNLEKYGLDSLIVDTPLEYQMVEIAKQVSLKKIGEKIDVSEEILAELNPELRHKILPSGSYPLKIPIDNPEDQLIKKDILLASIEAIPLSSPPTQSFMYHRVRQGETLSTIARKYRTTTGSIARANNIRKHNFIVAGKLLKIPQKGAYIPPPPKVSPASYNKASQHVVERGDSLWIIANRYGTTVKKIQEVNNLTSTNLHAGQVLKIPGPQGENPSAEGLKTYYVQAGDSPYTIATRYNMKLSQFLSINQLTDGSTIYPGQEVRVK